MNTESAESRLDRLFSIAFETNSPTMLDWVAIKFELKSLRRISNFPKVDECPSCKQTEDFEVQNVSAPAYIGVCQCGHRWEISNSLETEKTKDYSNASKI